MSARPTWMKWATEAEISKLFMLGLKLRVHQNDMNKVRKQVRDRCYQRARRNALKEGAKP